MFDRPGGRGPGLSPTMHAYDQVLNEGLAVIVEREEGDAELCWLWPEDAPDLAAGDLPEDLQEADSS